MANRMMRMKRLQRWTAAVACGAVLAQTSSCNLSKISYYGLVIGYELLQSYLGGSSSTSDSTSNSTSTSTSTSP